MEELIWNGATKRAEGHTEMAVNHFRYKRKKSSKIKGHTKSYGICLYKKSAWDEWNVEDWNNFFGEIESRLADALNILGMVQVTQK